MYATWFTVLFFLCLGVGVFIGAEKRKREDGKQSKLPWAKQPTDVEQPDAPAQQSRQQSKQETRVFSFRWLEDTAFGDWLEYDSKSRRMSCKMCKACKFENAFTGTGCGNFQRDGLIKHTKCQDHVLAVKRHPQIGAEQDLMREVHARAHDENVRRSINHMRNIYFLADHNCPMSM